MIHLLVIMIQNTKITILLYSYCKRNHLLSCARSKVRVRHISYSVEGLEPDSSFWKTVSLPCYYTHTHTHTHCTSLYCDKQSSRVWLTLCSSEFKDPATTIFMAPVQAYCSISRTGTINECLSVCACVCLCVCVCLRASAECLETVTLFASPQPT